MQPQPVDPFFAIFIGTLASASLATWFALAWRRRPLLPYEPRQPVPWNAVAPLLISLLVVLRISAVAFGEEPMPIDELATPLEMSSAILTGAAMQVALYGSLLVAAVALSGATQRDCGLPEFADQFGRDLAIGAVTWLAALLPVYAIQSLLAAVSEESSHPLIKMVQREPSVPLIFVAFISAVIVAPICEECAFRLLLEGWLEKVEDRWLGWRANWPVNLPQDSPPPATEEAAQATPDASADADSRDPLDAAIEPPRRGLAGLPYGWAPILISSLLFSLAHLGYGPDPVALFVLALMLGYVYQRTHRIIPCIVTHMLFNFTTLVILAIAAARGAGAE